MELPEFTEFWSADEQYGIRIPRAVFNALLEMCAEADGAETGGILVGRYNQQLNCAEVTAASRAPTDSRSGANWFARGVRGLQHWLNTLWRRGHYYLGEWHFHPDASPSPSGIDTLQMHEIAQSVSYRCPEPILIILGVNPRVGFVATALVFPATNAPVKLIRQENMEGWQASS